MSSVSSHISSNVSKVSLFLCFEMFVDCITPQNLEHSLTDISLFYNPRYSKWKVLPSNLANPMPAVLHSLLEVNVN